MNISKKVLDLADESGNCNFSEGFWGGGEMGPPGVLTSSAEYKSFRASVT